MPFTEAQIAAVREWAEKDPNPLTASATRELLNHMITPPNNNNNDLSCAAETLFQHHFGKRIAFGTAGLRSEMTFGPAHMNDLVVLQTAQGLVHYLLEYCKNQSNNNNNSNTNTYHPVVIIGYDHRQNASMQLSSKQFAIWTALVCETAGLDYLLLDGVVATPMVPYAMKYYSNNNNNKMILPLGIMVTASHNPKQDNGYKVYWIDGCQIRPPIDKGMSEAIMKHLTLWTDYSVLWSQKQQAAANNNNTSTIHDSNNYQHDNDNCSGLSDPVRTRQVIDSYMQELANAVLKSNMPTSLASSSSTTTTPFPLTIYYSAMHGVGYPFIRQAVDTACCHNNNNIASVQLVPVPSQQHPDPTFPTVDFPNPEEPGALDVAMDFAIQHYNNNTHTDTGTLIVLANDPDADRLAVAEYNHRTGTWKIFTGNELGALLAHWLYTITTTRDDNNDDDDECHDRTISGVNNNNLPLAMCCSTVSSQFVPTMAHAEGITCVETLTGFKWIGSQAAALQATGKVNVVFCYEEAIGFCCGNLIFDKDGISAAVYMIQLIAHVYQQELKQQQQQDAPTTTTRSMTLSDHLQSLYDKYGEFVSYNGYYRIPSGSDNAVIVASIMQHMQSMAPAAAVSTSAPAQPSSIGPYQIRSVRYLGEPGYDSTTDDRLPLLPTSASSPMMTIHFANGCVAHFRASGTEPKFKYYMEMKGAPGVPRAQVQAALEEMAPFILETLIEPSKYNMKQGM